MQFISSISICSQIPIFSCFILFSTILYGRPYGSLSRLFSNSSHACLLALPIAILTSFLVSVSRFTISITCSKSFLFGPDYSPLPSVTPLSDLRDLVIPPVNGFPACYLPYSSHGIITRICHYPFYPTFLALHRLYPFCSRHSARYYICLEYIFIYTFDVPIWESPFLFPCTLLLFLSCIPVCLSELEKFEHVLPVSGDPDKRQSNKYINTALCLQNPLTLKQNKHIIYL